MLDTAPFTPSLSPRFAAYVRDYLMDRGINPRPVFSACGVAFESNDETDQPIPVDVVAQLFEEAAQVASDSAIGLSMGRDFHYESSSLLIVAMLSAPSVNEGLQFLNRYDKFIDSGITTAFYPGRAPSEFVADLVHEGSAAMGQLNEYLMGFLVQTLTTATRQPVPLLHVGFQHTDSSCLEQLQEFFGCQLSFGEPHNSITFHPKYLDERFMTSNKLLFRVLQNVMETHFSIGDGRGGFLGSVCRQIMLETDISEADTETVAGRLNVSPRTLRRRLAEEGFTFQGAKNLARERQAKYLLANGNASLTEIAFELGYSELSAFSRAFRAWSGETPQVYRDNIRALIR